MENASKALIFVASTLIAVMILSLMVYIFRRFGDTAASTEKRYSDQEILAFNAKFAGYETGGEHSLNDTLSITKVRDGTNDTITNSYFYDDLFKGNITNSEDYNKALVVASQTLNKGSDVVTAINDAINVNHKNNNGYKYGNLEIQNSVEIIVDLGDNGSGSNAINKFNFSKRSSSSHFRYLVIEPNQNVKDKRVYGFSSGLSLTGENTEDKKMNANNLAFGEGNSISVYDMLSEFRETKVININNKSYTVYKYYFFGEVLTNDETGLIETIKFKLVKDKNF